ncbi:unnamed protein product [Urochloa decumbens]|uniref:Uncharacterized protein n=1 Tax=Urochloa decumbens TaxID=240449 RepID=A0ABC8ZWA6_9POAL
MPPLDLDTLVSCDGGGELTAACGCDTALSEDGSGAAEEHEEEEDDPYAPAQSLRLRIGEDIEWSDVAAAVAVLERDDSTKGAGANPKCAARRSVAAAAAAARGSAPRAAVAAVVIGGLPGKAAREHGRRRSPRRPGSGCGGRASRVFAAGEAAAANRLVEPGSPKVSCLGGVRSQPRAAAEGVRGRWWACLVVGRRERRRPRGSEAD